MLRTFFAILILSSVTFVGSVKANHSLQCGILSQIGRLSAEFADVRSGKNTQVGFLGLINQVQSKLRTQAFADVSETYEIIVLKQYIETIKQQFLNERDITAVNRKRAASSQLPVISKPLEMLVNHYSCNMNAIRTDGVDNPITTIENSSDVLSNSDSAHALTSPDTLKNSVISGWFLFIIIAVICILGIPIIYWFIERSEKTKQQSDCHTKTLMTFGDNCTVSCVVSVGSRGAKLQAPFEEIPIKSVHLYLAGFKIPAKIKWANKYYVGLSFVTALSDEVVKKIVEASHDKDQLVSIGKNATDCYFPGCHHDCLKNRLTQFDREAKKVALA